MGDQLKLDEDGNCPTCDQLAPQGEHVQCFSCNDFFHAACKNASPDQKVASRTMINGYLLPSTERNFLFFCDRCLTEIEINKSESDARRINLLENKMAGMDQKLSEIMALLMTPNKTEIDNILPAVSNPTLAPINNIWFDKERLDEVKAPEPKAVLVINKTPDHQTNEETREIVEQVVTNNNVSLRNSHTNNDGDLVIVCESKEARDELKDLVHEADESIKMNSPSVKLNTITLVGLQKAYDKEEVIRKLVTQNDFLRRFIVRNDITEHMKIHIIKPLWNKPTVFQAVASISPVLREGFRSNKDKVIIGLTSCKIYDKKQAKRCYNCQEFGHMAKSCPTATVPSCGKCGENHRTDQCTSDERNCINCKRNGALETNHSVFYYKCPTLVKYLEAEQKNKHLNSNSKLTQLAT